jgi:5-methylcytosine-specific restriction endonuclease McrA
MSTVSPARRRAVLDRDGWQCQMPVCLCPAGRAIDPGLPVTGPWGASADHVRERSRGGRNSMGNLRAAHRACNGARPPEPPPLRSDWQQWDNVEDPRDPLPPRRQDPYDRLRQAERDRRAGRA